MLEETAQAARGRSSSSRRPRTRAGRTALRHVASIHGARLGEYLASEEAAAIRDALPIAEGWFDAIFVVRPGTIQPPRWTPAARSTRSPIAGNR